MVAGALALLALCCAGPLAAQRGALTAPRNLAQMVETAGVILQGRILSAKIERDPHYHALWTVVVALRVAFSGVSGYLFTGDPGQSLTCTTAGTAECNTGGSPDGSRDPRVAGTFDIPVTPGTYTVAAESINPNFSGGSSVGPLAEPIPMPGNAAAGQQVTVTAGGSVTVNITLAGTAPRFDEFETSELLIGGSPSWDLPRGIVLRLWERRDGLLEAAAR
jgi:hypothetical protein